MIPFLQTILATPATPITTTNIMETPALFLLSLGIMCEKGVHRRKHSLQACRLPSPCRRRGKRGRREENKKTQFNMQYSLPLSIPQQHRPSLAQAAVMSAGLACSSCARWSSILGASSTPFASSTARLSSVASSSLSSWPLGSELSGL